MIILVRELLFGRFTVWYFSIVLALGSLSGFYFLTVFIWPLALVSGLAILGLRYFLKSTHPVRVNYPLMGRLRYLLESVRSELRQYFWKSDGDELPYSRNQRAMVYQRAND